MNLEALSAMAMDIELAEDYVASLEQQLKEANASLERKQLELAAAMENEDCKEFVTNSGLKVSIKRDFRVTLPKDRAEGIAWLEANGYGESLKNLVTVAMGRGMDVGPVKSALMALGLAPDVKADIPWQTLTKLAKEIEEEGKEFDREKFNVLDRMVAKIKRA